jgi:hypothetical protein
MNTFIQPRHDELGADSGLQAQRGPTRPTPPTTTALIQSEARKLRQRTTKLDQAARQRNKKLRRDGEAGNLSREERKMTAIMWQIEEMEQREKAVKAGPCSPQSQLEGSVGRGNKNVGKQRRQAQ